MGKLHQKIDDGLRAFIEAQRLFFVATAPLSASGHVNLSPKGLDSLRVLDSARVAYLDHVGSGAETIAHLKENGRIVLMLCAFDGPPKIVRLHGRGVVRDPGSAEFHLLRPRFPATASDVRSVIEVEVSRVSDSCGFGIPLHEFRGERPQLPAWAGRKGADGLKSYQREKNAASIDGLPAVTWMGEDQ